jgi:hypothetical protein
MTWVELQLFHTGFEFGTRVWVGYVVFAQEQLTGHDPSVEPDALTKIPIHIKTLISWISRLILTLDQFIKYNKNRIWPSLHESSAPLETRGWYVQNLSTFPNTFDIVLLLICVFWMQLRRTNAVFSRTILVSHFCAEIQLSGKSS